MYTVQIPKSACGTAMFTTEVTNETTYYMECQFSMTRQNSMKLTISFSKNTAINMHVHVSSAVNIIYLMIKVAATVVAITR